jgi:hypothetical protein
MYTAEYREFYNQKPRKPKKGWLKTIITIAIIIPFLVLFWIFIGNAVYTSTFVATSLAGQFFEAGAAGDVDRMTAMIAPELREKTYNADYLKKEIIPKLVNYEKFDFRKSSFGTSRKGVNSTSVSCYLKYRNSKDERSASISFTQIDGKWYVSSVSISSVQ